MNYGNVVTDYKNAGGLSYEFNNLRWMVHRLFMDQVLDWNGEVEAFGYSALSQSCKDRLV